MDDVKNLKDYIKVLEAEVGKLDEEKDFLRQQTYYWETKLHSERVKHGQTKAILKRVLGR